MGSQGFVASPPDATNGRNVDAESSLDVTDGGNDDFVLFLHVDSTNEIGNGPQPTKSCDSIPTVKSGGYFDIVMFVRRNTDDEMVDALSVGTHSHNEVGFLLAWHSKAVQVEEGRIMVKGKKAKLSKPSFDMTLHSHKSSANCKY